MTNTSKNEDFSKHLRDAQRAYPSGPHATFEQKYTRVIRLARGLSKFTRHLDFCTVLSPSRTCNCGLEKLKFELGK